LPPNRQPQQLDHRGVNESFANLIGQTAEQKAVLDRALHTLPEALRVLSDQRGNLTEAVDSFGRFSALTADTVNQTEQALVSELSLQGRYWTRWPTRAPR
jgi:phospholipid/cholesterol/gamma-HCH transport system substrate-binding protein